MSRSPRSSRRPRTTKRSTPRCGSKSSRASAPPPTICSPPLRAKTTSGPTCTILSPRLQRKRAFPSWRRSSASSARSSAITRSATARCCATSRPPRSLKRARSRSGSAATAATSSSAPRPPTSAPPATTPRATSNPRGELLRIGKLTREPQAVPAALLLFTYSFGSRMQIVVPLPSSL